MKFINDHDYNHGSIQPTGILITNLGTPDAPTKKALKKYLKQFLSDPRLVESTFPRWVWLLILNLVILNIRPARSAKAYQQVWGHFGDGSPLLDIARQQLSGLEERLKHAIEGPVECALGMRYGNPSIPSALEELKKKNVRKLIVLPLYPQYSATTTGSTFDEVTSTLRTWRWIPELRFINHYHNHPAYIEALCQSIEEHWKTHGQAQKLIMSYHGIPKRYLLNGDPYHCECHVTSRLVAEQLGLDESQYMTTFQSIFGREEWLKPYTADTLKSLPTQGVKDIQIICPGFSADCLETIEEIEEENKDYFIQAGGEKFTYIPALNARDDHLKALTSIIQAHTQGWNVFSNHDLNLERNRKKSQELYEKLRKISD